MKKNVPKMDRVIAGVGGYLLLGLFWAMPLYLVHILTPNSIISLIDEEAISRSEILYFSFVSLTTLGYGDIVPNSPFARVIAMFVSLSGVLYLAIFISALIGSPREPRK
ncbi:MAG: potassium channel family protein [Akkermansiaceae bacterium]